MLICGLIGHAYFIIFVNSLIDGFVVTMCQRCGNVKKVDVRDAA